MQNRSQTEKDAIINLITHYHKVFSRDKYELGLTHLTKHEIHTVRQHPTRVPLAFAGEEKKVRGTLQKQVVIHSSNSPWASPIMLV